jgi:hypothetical protein
VGIGLLWLHNAWATMLGYHAAMLIVVLKWGTGAPAVTTYRGRGWKWPLAASLPGLAGGALLYLLWPLLSLPVNLNSYVQSMGLNGDIFPWFAAYFVAVNPLIEEYYWRGWLGSGRKRPELNDLLFAGYHPLVLAGAINAGWLLVILAVLLGGAWFWRQLNRLNGGLLASTLSHFAADAGVMTAACFLLFSPT